MNVEINISQVLTICSAVLAGYWFLAKMIIGQFKKSLDEKFSDGEDARKISAQKWDANHATTQGLITDLSIRLVALESEMKHVPTAKQLGELAQIISIVRGDNQTQTELLKRIENQMRLINEWMLENK